MKSDEGNLAPAFEHLAALRVSVPPNYAAARAAAARLRAFLASHGLADAELGAWELVAAEALNNAVEYVLPEFASAPVVMDASVSSGAVELRVSDHTQGFELPFTPDLPPEESESGRGLFLILTLTDSAEYFRGRRGNTLVLTRGREVRPGAPSRTPAEVEAELASMTEELAASFESLASIFQFTAELCNTNEPLALVSRWMTELGRITGADWHSFHSLDSAGSSLVRLAWVGEDVPERLPLTDAGANAACMATRAIQSRQDVWFDPGTICSPGDPFTASLKNSSGLVHPVYMGGQLVGIAAFGRRVDSYPFTAGQVNVIHTFADFLGTQVRVAQVQGEAVANSILRREVEIAAAIQQSLLPSYIPRLPGYHVEGSAVSAREVGGDFYDVLETATGGWLLVIADVMGKGIPAALFASILRTLIRSRRDLARRPGALMAWLNATLFPDFDRVEMFATVQLAFLDTLEQSLNVCSAGHCPLLLVDPAGVISELPADGIPIGISEDASYYSQQVPFRPGSRALLFTDGLIEARSPAGAGFGLEALRRWLSGATPPTPVSLRHELAEHESGAASADDQTFLLLTAHAHAASNPIS